MQHGDKWRKFRKLVHQQLNEGRVEREHVTLVNAEATQMMRDFCISPEGMMLHPKRFSNSIIMSQGQLRLDARYVAGSGADSLLQSSAFVAPRRKPLTWWSYIN